MPGTRWFLRAVVVCCATISPTASAQYISTHSGGDIGDGRPVLAAQLHGVSDLAFDASGTLYIADEGDGRIRKILANGSIATVAGNGRWISGTGNCDFQLHAPTAFVINAAGNFVVADSYDNCLQEVTPDGRTTPLAGTGFFGSSPDGTPAAVAKIDAPGGVAINASGEIVFAESGNSRIRKIDVNGKLAGVAGRGVPAYNGDGYAAVDAALNNPTGIAYDSNGNLYIADTNNNVIRRVDAAGIISTFAGTGNSGYSGDGGPASAAQLYLPLAVRVDSHGDVYISDTGNGVVRRVDGNGSISTVAGNGAPGIGGDGDLATQSSLGRPRGVALDPFGNLFVGDSGRVVKIDVADKRLQRVAGGADYPDGTPLLAASFFLPTGIAVDAAGNVYVVDSRNNRIRRASIDGTVSTVAGNGTTLYSGDNGPARSAGLVNPNFVAVDTHGNLYIADDARIRQVDASGNIRTIAGTGIEGCGGAALIATGVSIGVVHSVAVDTRGNVYAADPRCGVIRKVDPSGAMSIVAGTGQFGYSDDGGLATEATLLFPLGVAVDQEDNLYIADSYSDRIRKVDAAGIISTVAGVGHEGFGGDGGPAVNAVLCAPNAIAFDEAGNLFISDQSNGVVRKVDTSGTISTAAGAWGSGPGLIGNPGPGSMTFLGIPESVAAHGGTLYVSSPVNERIQKINPDEIFAAGFQ